MDRDLSFEDLLRRWCSLLEQDGDAPIEDLCVECPELATDMKERLQAVASMMSFMGLGPNLTSLPLRSPNHEKLGGVDAPDLIVTPASPGSCPTEPATDAPVTRTAGTSGVDGNRFRVLRPHAKGGLGAVYVALDAELNREVALKQILDRHAEDADSRCRFRLEAEVTGQLEHPGIVPVYGLGTDANGRPYYAMRFIRGQSLKTAIDNFHAADGPRRDPSERALALRELLRRFIDVCHAIEYAHSRGVLHRDLKPGNIMLGKYGETLVVDWGLAKPFGPSFRDPDRCEHPVDLSGASGPAVTLPGSAIGTPQFMSPAQASGRLDEAGPRCDIYSLGATLYSLLTGRPAFPDRDVSTVLEKVRNGEFPRPAEVKPGVPRPLEAVCIRAMALKPEDRYPSALDLAEEIKHWFADEPVSAYRDPLLTRVTRWTLRHKTAVAAVASLVLTALVVATVGALLINQARRGEKEQKQLATLNFGLALRAADDLLVEVGEVDLADVPQMESARRTLLEKAGAGYARFLGQDAGHPAARIGAGRAYARLGDVEELMGKSDEAERSYRNAVRTLAPLAGEFPSDADADVRRDLARAHHGLAGTLKKVYRFRESEQEFREAIRLRQALTRQPDATPADHQALADSRYHLGSLLARLKRRRPEDEEAYRAALEAQRDLVERNRDRPEAREKLARYLNNLSVLLHATGRPRDAEESLNEALRLLWDVSREKPNVPGPLWQYARAENNLAMNLKDRGGRPPARAGELLGNARALLDSLAQFYPMIPQYRQELASVESNLGLLKRDAGDPDGSAEHYQRALELLKALVDAHPAVPDYRHKYAVALFNRNLIRAPNNLADAEPAFTESVSIQERLASDFPEVADYPGTLGHALFDWAELLARRNDLASARRRFEGAVRSYRAALAANPDDPRNLRSLCQGEGELALVLIRTGEHARAAGLIEDLCTRLPDDPGLYHLAAVRFLQCAEAARRDQDLPEPRRRRIADDCSGRAMSALREGAARGVITSPDQLDLEALGPLNDRDDFKALLKGLDHHRSPRKG